MFFGGDPFEHFASSGGMPGGGSRRGPSRDVDTTKLYEALGVSFNICVVIFFMLLDIVWRCNTSSGGYDI